MSLIDMNTHIIVKDAKSGMAADTRKQLIKRGRERLGQLQFFGIFCLALKCEKVRHETCAHF